MTPGVDMYRNRSTTSQDPQEALAAHHTSAPKSADVLSMAEIAVAELEQMANEDNTRSAQQTARQSFPAACRAILQEMEGNSRCLDCGKKHPEWAAVSYGALICLQCAGVHRSMGVNVSTVRSVTMDHWRHDEVVKMLEGGNRQIAAFFQRHALSQECVEFQSPQLNAANVTSMRYKTKAALFYRQQLEHHVHSLLTRGPYRGRRRTTKRRPLGTQASELS
eukprot:Nitzschia sp. Nitz4//scaffold87_size112219//51922//52584//NITZ4_004074-RA/size112219-processed-gene-0.23-mRNA-1//-1//CDS//3329559369//3369//frame0